MLRLDTTSAGTCGVEAASGKVQWKTLATLAVLYFFSASGRIGIADSDAMLDVTRALLSASITIPEGPDRLIGADGQTYCHYGLLTSLWWIPPVLVGRLLARYFTSFSETMWEEFMVSLADGVVVVLTLAYVDWAWRKRGMAAQKRRWGLWGLGVGTILWPYAKISLSDPLMTLCLFAAFVHWRSSDSLVSASAAGIWLGLALLSRKQAQVLIPVFVLYFAWCSAHAKTGRRLTSALAGIMPMLLIQFWYNYSRWGNPFLENYASVNIEQVGLLDTLRRCGGLLFGEQSGLFLYSPLLLISLGVGFTAWWRCEPGEVLLTGTLLATQFVLLPPLPYWNNVWTFGSRYLLFLVPFLALSWEHCHWPVSSWQKPFWLAASSVGLAIAILGVTTDALAAHWRRELYPPPGIPILRAHASEFARVLGTDRTPPPKDEPFADVYWKHPAFQVPDIWLCHFVRHLRSRSSRHGLEDDHGRGPAFSSPVSP